MTGERVQRALIGLGANLGDPIQQLRDALSLLITCLPAQRLAASQIYQSAPLGGLLQPDYYNAVVHLELLSSHSPHSLLSELKAVEAALGRPKKHKKWSSRVIDCDLLLCDDRVIKSHDLIVPHPGILNRVFVYYPLYEILPGLVLPCGVVLADVCQPGCEASLKCIEPLIGSERALLC